MLVDYFQTYLTSQCYDRSSQTTWLIPYKAVPV